MMKTDKVLISLYLTTTVYGCLVGKGDERCDENQEYRGSACHCIEGTVPASDGIGCVECGPNQVIKEYQCVCDEGFEQLVEDGPCIEKPEGLGEPCTPSDGSCNDRYPVCVVRPSGTGLCTNECDTGSDCADGFGCTSIGEGKKVCTPPASGDAVECTTQEDCAGFDAHDCSLVGRCIVRGCSEEIGCWGDAVCCDFSHLGATTACMSPAATDALSEEYQSGDVCPEGSKQVGGGQ